MKARKRFGQHFLERTWAAKLVEAIAPQPADTFLEIGPGTGALTTPLSERARHVVAVEVDRDLAARLARTCPGNVTVVAADILSVPLPSLLGHVPPAGGADPRTRVVGNLPYNISSPILFTLLRAVREGLPLADATLMLQREVATRIAAAPGGGDWGPLAVFVQLRARVSQLFVLPPGAFRPVPKVQSAVVRLEFRPPEVELADEAVFELVVRSIFTRRRKMLVNALEPAAASFGRHPAEVVAKAGLDGRRRPETLHLVELSRLAAVLVPGNGRGVV